MIYISTGFCKNSIPDVVDKLVLLGVKNIELSGGKYKKNLTYQIKKKYPDINFLFHNYFPPVKNGFVLNLASTNKRIFNRTLKFYLKSIKLCKQFSIKKYGIHAGFFNDILVSELNKKIKQKKKINKKLCIEQLEKGYRILNKAASGKVKIYLENNVLTKKNLKSFNNTNPFILTCYKDYVDLQKKFKFNILLDVGHLKVTCNTLNLSFKNQLKLLSKKTDYFHLSNNNSVKDQNFGFANNPSFLKLIRNNLNKQTNTITLEIYKNIPFILRNAKILKNLLKI